MEYRIESVSDGSMNKVVKRAQIEIDRKTNDGWLLKDIQYKGTESMDVYIQIYMLFEKENEEK